MTTYVKSAIFSKDTDVDVLGSYLNGLIVAYKKIEEDGKGKLGRWNIEVSNVPEEMEPTHLLITISGERDENPPSEELSEKRSNRKEYPSGPKKKKARKGL